MPMTSPVAGSIFLHSLARDPLKNEFFGTW
jgi:hypothetical protein